jgi:TorA maturation chaperone TorD
MGGADLLTAHRLAYQFLGAVFSGPPAEELVRRVVVEDLFADWPLETDEPEVRTGLALLRDFCRSPGAERLAPLLADHGRLFEVPGEAFVRPWESVYRSEEHLLFERETREVAESYRRFGMEVPNPGAEPEDHLGLELRFVAHLCVLGEAAIARGDRAALREVVGGMGAFFDEHLTRWAEPCLLQVIGNARTAYYRGAAHLARGCIAETRGAIRAWERAERGHPPPARP